MLIKDYKLPEFRDLRAGAIIYKYHSKCKRRVVYEGTLCDLLVKPMDNLKGLTLHILYDSGTQIVAKGRIRDNVFIPQFDNSYRSVTIGNLNKTENNYVIQAMNTPPATAMLEALHEQINITVEVDATHALQTITTFRDKLVTETLLS